MSVKPIPDGYHSVTPFLNVHGAEQAIDFLVRAFGAEERSKMKTPSGAVAHAEVRIGDSVVMLSEATATAPTTSMLLLYVSDCDAVYAKALAAGAKSHMEPKDQPWGDRFARVVDPFGNDWSIATHIEDISRDEMDRRMRAATGG